MATHSASNTPNLQIEAIQTVTPTTVTDPQQAQQVSVADSIGSGIFRGCFNIALYYKKSVEENDSGWLVAGWMRESLSRILSELPMLSGRLRRRERGDGELEIVSNDSGIRLIEARIATNLSEFLDLKGREEEAEADLVYWKEIDEQSPQFSPLVYVQVTNFQCGGYSVGISCSLLLADLLVTNFLKRWVQIHSNLFTKNCAPSTPFFYLPRLKQGTGSLNGIISSSSSKGYGQTMFFKITADETVNFKKLALLCVEEAEHKLCGKKASKFSLFVKESSELIKVEVCSKHEVIEPQLNHRSQVICGNWDDLGANEVAFGQGNKPTHVSYWIGSIFDGLVIGIPSADKGVSPANMIVTIPKEN